MKSHVPMLKFIFFRFAEEDDDKEVEDYMHDQNYLDDYSTTAHNNQHETDTTLTSDVSDIGKTGRGLCLDNTPWVEVPPTMEYCDACLRTKPRFHTCPEHKLFFAMWEHSPLRWAQLGYMQGAFRSPARLSNLNDRQPPMIMKNRCEWECHNICGDGESTSSCPASGNVDEALLCTENVYRPRAWSVS